MLTSRLEDEVVSLKGALSDQIDVDLPQTISDLTARQAAFEASLRTVVKQLRDDGARVILCTPSIFDETMNGAGL